MITLRTSLTKVFDLKKLTILLLEIVLLTAHYLLSSSAGFFALSFPLGILSYILIPGFVITNSLTFLRSKHDLCWDLLFGLSVPILLLSVFWSFHVELDFKVAIPFLLAIFVFVMLAIKPLEFEPGFWKKYLAPSILLILLLTIGIRLYYLSANSSSIAVDGSLYSDIARTIASDGRFSSKIIEGTAPNPYSNLEGAFSYPLTIFSIATFFLMGGVSFLSGNLTVLFVGTLLVLLIYKISYVLFGKRTAIVSGLISSFLPLLAYYSTILYGPEILSALFVLASLYFFLEAVRNKSKSTLMILSGLFASMAFGAWGLIPFFTLSTSLAIIFLLYYFPAYKKLCLYGAFLLIDLFFVYKFSAILYVELFFVIIPFVCLLIIKKKHWDSNSLGITVFISAIISSLQLFFIRSYLSAVPYITGMEHVIVPLQQTLVTNPIRAINPFLLPGGIQTNINYLVNSFGRFWQSLIVVLAPILFGLFIAAFLNSVKFKEKLGMLVFPCVASAIFVITFSEYEFWYGNILSDRFLILPACFAIILSSVTINTLISTVPAKVPGLPSGTRIKAKLTSTKVKKLFLALTVVVIFISLIPLQISYLANYNAGYTNVINWYGKEPLNWIENSTLPTDVFASLDANRLALFTDREFVDLTPQSGQLDAEELNSVIEQFHVNYVIIDTFLIDYSSHTSLFDYLYTAPLNESHLCPIVDSDSQNQMATALISSKNSTSAQSVYALSLEYEFSENSRVFRVFKVINATSLTNIEFRDDNFLQGWTPQRGTLDLDASGAKVSTINNNDWAYISFGTSNILLNSSANQYLAVEVKGNDSSSKFWIALADSNGTWNEIQDDTSAPQQFQIYTYDISGELGQNLTNIYLGVSGVNMTSVTYGWIMIYSVSLSG